MLELFEKQSNESAREYAFRVLRHNIVSLRLKPGQILRENELTQYLKLSRTPLREAILKLSSIYLVEVVAQKETRVALIDTDLIEEARELRLILETHMAQKACASATNDDIMRLSENIHMQDFQLNCKDFFKLMELDNQFHYMLFKIAKAEKTHEAMQSISGHYDIVRNISLQNLSSDKAVSDHKVMLGALKDKDKAALTEIVRDHISRYSDEANFLQEKYPTFFKNL